MSYLGSWKINDYVPIAATTHRFSTGEAYAPTVLTYSIYEDGDTTGIVKNVDMVPASPFDNITGLYLVRRQLTSPDFEQGKNYTIVIKATVDGVSAITTHSFQIEAEVSSNTISSASLDDIAEALLKYDFSSISGEATRSVINALRKLMNKIAIEGSTLSIYKEDDTSVAFTQTVGTDASAEPLISLDTNS